MCIYFYKIFFFWDWHALYTGNFLVLGPLMEGLVWNVQEQSQMLELMKDLPQDVVMERWRLVIGWRQNNDSAEEPVYGAGSSFIWLNYIKTVATFLLLLLCILLRLVRRTLHGWSHLILTTDEHHKGFRFYSLQVQLLVVNVTRDLGVELFSRDWRYSVSSWCSCVDFTMTLSQPSLILHF